ncbi:MAG: DNA primase [Marinilabiliaceae bacterium]|nr:DNA primase [Marinilabiliaceae bacterium]
MIDSPTIERVVETAQSQIVEVISEYVNLKKRGINYIGHCPFHNEKTPSFSVSQHKGIFKCFGCGKGGNAVHFVVEHEQISWIEAIKMLGKKFNIHIEEKELSTEDIYQKNERDSMLIVTEFASKFFSRIMYDTDEGLTMGLLYFRSRGYRDDIIKKFGLGYSPEQRDALTQEALKNGYKLEFLEKTGLTTVKDNNRSDKFRGRVMFPIHGLSGKIIAFGGRTLKTEPNAAKYLNSPESEIYHKSKILYGIFQARQEISRQDKTYLVEGYTDVIAFHQAGLINTVASSGTALTVDQIRLMARFSPNVTIIYDGDPAGIKASLRGINLILEEGMNVKVLLLPEGEDPDSFAKKNDTKNLIKFIKENETDFIKFKTSLLIEESKNDPIKRAQLIQDIVSTIAIIPDPIIKAVYVKECSSLLKVEEPILYQEINKIIKKKNEKESTQAFIQSQREIKESLGKQAPVLAITNPFNVEEREILKYLIKYDQLTLCEIETDEGKKCLTVGEYIVNELKQDEIQSSNPLHNNILQLYEEHYNDAEFSARKFFINHPNPEVSRIATDLLIQKHRLSKIHKKKGTLKQIEDVIGEIVPRVVLELKWKMIKIKIDECTEKLKKAEESGDFEKIPLLIQEKINLDNAFKFLSLQQGERIVT